MTNDIAGVVIELLDTHGADIDALFSSLAVMQRTTFVPCALLGL